MRFRAHPLYLIRNIGFWGLLAAITFLKQNRIALLFGALGLLLVSIVRYCRFELKINGRNIVLQTGFLRIRTAEIPIKNISSVEIFRYPTDRIFSAMSVRINTEAGRRGGDCRLVLPFSQKAGLLSALNIKEFENIERFSFGQVLLLAAAASSAVNGIILVIPLLNRVGSVIGAQLPRLVFEQIDNISRSLPYFERIKNGLTLVFAFFYLCALSFYLAVYARFETLYNTTHICVQYGILTRRSIFINTASVGGYISVRTPLMLLFKRSFTKADIAHSKRRGERSVLLEPAVKLKENNQFTGNKRPLESDSINVLATSGYRFYKYPFFVFSALTLLFCISTHFFRAFWQLFLFLYCFSLVYVILLVVYAAFSCRKQKIHFGKTFLATFTKGYELQQACVFAHNIGIIKITRFPLDIKEKTCSIKITLRTKSAFTIGAKYISFRTVCEQISETFRNDE